MNLIASSALGKLARSGGASSRRKSWSKLLATSKVVCVGSLLQTGQRRHPGVVLAVNIFTHQLNKSWQMPPSKRAQTGTWSEYLRPDNFLDGTVFAITLPIHIMRSVRSSQPRRSVQDASMWRPELRVVEPHVILLQAQPIIVVFRRPQTPARLRVIRQSQHRRDRAH